MQSDSHPPAPRCAHCGEVIGVYEPLVAMVEGVPYKTSRAAESGLLPTGATYHGACYESLDDDGFAAG
jgi:hypothetical protein